VPSPIICWARSGSSSTFTRALTRALGQPSACAAPVSVRPRSSIARTALASSYGFSCLRAMFSTARSTSSVPASRTTTGTSASSSERAAASRWKPATSSKPSPSARTTSGTSTPCQRDRPRERLHVRLVERAHVVGHADAIERDPLPGFLDGAHSGTSSDSGCDRWAGQPAMSVARIASKKARTSRNSQTAPSPCSAATASRSCAHRTSPRSRRST
jgi:hypothetical protein